VHIYVDTQDPSNNCPLGFSKLTVIQPMFHTAVLSMIANARAWCKRLGKSQVLSHLQISSYSMLQCVAVCGSVSQCVVACCRMG